MVRAFDQKPGHRSVKESVTHPRTGTTIRSPRIVAKREHVREQLVAAGGRLFAAHGLVQVSVEDILAEAEISRRTFYSYFANKFELVAGLINPALAAGADMLVAVRAQPAEQVLPGIVDCYRQLWDKHSDALTVISSLDPVVMPYIEQGHRQFGAALKAVLEVAETTGQLRNDDALRTFKIISRTAVPLLKIYADHPDGDRLYREAMLALLGKVP